MILWDDKDQVKRQIALEVTQDLEAIKEKLYRVLPGERIKVEAAQGSVILSGTASSPGRMESALSIAKTYAGAEKVINLLQVGGAQQVLLEVRVAEVKRSIGKELESNLIAAYDDGNGFKVGAINGRARNNQYEINEITTLTDGRGNTSTKDEVTGLKNLITPFFPESILSNALIASIASGNFNMDMYLRAAETEGLGRILAEPNLTTLSGQEADFLSGGQFPVQVLGQNGTTGIEYKDYGVKLKFIPFVMDSGKISLKVNVSVSELGPPILMGDAGYGQSVLTRGANATVEVPSGQTIAIAGMLDEKSRDSANRFPGLGNIPILGALFRSQDFQQDRTELVIFVTPDWRTPLIPNRPNFPPMGSSNRTTWSST
jgi:pilus assembly protein CpaC